MCRVAVGLGVIPSDTWSTGLHGSMLDSEDAVILGSCIWGINRITMASWGLRSKPCCAWVAMKF